MFQVVHPETLMTVVFQSFVTVPSHHYMWLALSVYANLLLESHRLKSAWLLLLVSWVVLFYFKAT